MTDLVSQVSQQSKFRGMPSDEAMMKMMVDHSEEMCDIIDESKRKEDMKAASDAIADELTKAIFEAKDGEEMK